MKMRTKLLIIFFLSASILLYNCGDADRSDISFGVIADVQYRDGNPDGSRNYRESISKLQECVVTLNSQELDFVIQLGDIIDGEFASYDSILPIFQKLTMSKYHILGNHEFSIKERYKESILNKLGLKNQFYDFKIDSWRFIVLDGNDISFQGTSVGSDKYQLAETMYKKITEQKLPNAHKWNGALGEEQITWLQTSLERADQANEKVIIFCHFPVLPGGMHTLWNEKRIIEILEQYDCVKAYINGHNHQGNYLEQKGIHYITIQGMVETPDRSAFAVININSDSLRITGNGREPNRTISLK